MSKRFLNVILLILSVTFLSIILFVLYVYNIIPHKFYMSNDFEIITIRSQFDADHDGIDDYTDIFLGAKAEIERRPTYFSAYYDGGYPPSTEGVCTDVIWRALKDAGYDLKALMDMDIQNHLNAYPYINAQPDPNIDFRRVPNIRVFLERHTLSLTTDLSDVEKWQLGDIVVFSDQHIGILSNKRNWRGIPFLLHNGNLPVQEEDALKREQYLKGISGHYRFILQ